VPGTYIHRFAERQLRELADGLRVVIVNGPRQSGKTTLLRMYQEQTGATYVTLDDPFQLAQARADPVTFVAQGPAPLIIDEVQRGGDDLVRAIKILVDERRDRGQFILSGSAKFLTVPTLSESLAGRAGFVDLWPLSLAERTDAPADWADRLFADPGSLLDVRHSPWTRDGYLDLITEGGFPEVLDIPSASVRRSWYSGYLNTVIVRDIGGFAAVRNAEAIPQVLALVAARAGSTLVLADVAKDMAISQSTARNYLAYLEMVFLTVTLPAWSTNLTSKIVKTPKAFVADSGLAANLLRATPDALRAPGHPALGGLLETFVLSELNKLRAVSATDFAIHHLRDRAGAEVDFVLEGPDGKVAGIEVKASASPSSGDAKHLRWLKEKLGDNMTAGVVLHLGNTAGSLGDGVYALPVASLWGQRPLPSSANAVTRDSLLEAGRSAGQGLMSTLRLVRSAMSWYPAGTPLRSVVASKTFPGSMVPSRMSGISSSA
jgi:predicted AAA+ superfamily ATPase